MQCILERANRGQVVVDPFPHLILHEALEPEYYRELAAEFPAAEIILDGRLPVSNRNFRYPASAILGDQRISALWREFTAYHVSQQFFNKVLELFDSRILEMHPKIEASVGKRLPEWRSSVRFREPIHDIALECQFTYGTPVEERSRVIGPHVDREVALYAGLFYMRDEHDDSDGGDLEFYQFKAGKPMFAQGTRCVADDRVTRCKTIRYASNTLVFFLHSPFAVHGVSPRSPTRFARRHINLVGELATKVFDVSSSVGRTVSG